MPYARPLYRTPKRHLVASPGQFKDLEGKTFPHKRGGSWKVGALYKIIDTRAKTGHSTWAKMMYLATCTRCGEEQHIEARELKTGTGCKYCRATDKRDRAAQRKAERLAKAEHKATLKAERCRPIDEKLPALILAGLSAKQIAQSLGIEVNVVVHRLRVNGLKTQHPKRSKGQLLDAAGKLVTGQKQRNATLSERKFRQRVWARIQRGTPALLVHFEGKLKTGAKGPRLSPEERTRRERQRRRIYYEAIKRDPKKLEALRIAARRQQQRLKRGLDPDAPIMKPGRKRSSGVR